MANLRIENLTKNFDEHTVLSDINLNIGQGEFFSIVGPSGCGKTTLLRIIAGLEFPDSGNIFINGKDITSLPPQKRRIGIVFQNYALFPNMSVFDNIAYGLRIQKTEKQDLESKIKSVLEIVSLSHKIHNSVTSLSGGEQQRVSLARVIVTEPELILFDEPLSNLDYTLRIETRNELKRLQRDVGITSVYVTHDQTEALALSDRVAVLNKGVVQQTGTPDDVYYHPVNNFVAGFIGHANLFDEKSSEKIFNVKTGKNKFLALLPEDIIPVKDDVNKTGQITEVQFTGFSVEYSVNIFDNNVKILCLSSSDTGKFKDGEYVTLKLKSDNLTILDG
ncbi:MAG TPA: ABC transporter ATP-binding protein [Ignavibacteria bacterium]|nr:ABC transporter ATP-binding protein [Bacteroidota bacterium]HRI85498.1 ABC transporter ATP-binding protein [Ignavibacteria bacterium]HRJ99280.1 ABC transporter ATP-binding protein [Ignavibacteria bacterium]